MRLGMLFVAASAEAGEQHANQERQRDKERREARERVACGEQNASKTTCAQDGYQTDVCASCLAPAGSVETAMVHRMLVFLLSLTAISRTSLSNPGSSALYWPRSAG